MYQCPNTRTTFQRGASLIYWSKRSSPSLLYNTEAVGCLNGQIDSGILSWLQMSSNILLFPEFMPCPTHCPSPLKTSFMKRLFCPYLFSDAIIFQVTSSEWLESWNNLFACSKQWIHPNEDRRRWEGKYTFCINNISMEITWAAVRPEAFPASFKNPSSPETFEQQCWRTVFSY